MLTEKQIQEICIADVSKLNLKGGCQDFVRALRSGNDIMAANKLEEAITLSIARCINAVLKQYK